MNEAQRTIRYHTYTHFLAHCRPPTVAELSGAAHVPNAMVERILAELAEQHHIVLYGPGVAAPSPIAMAHPFSHLPTVTTVTHGSKSWWANCVWCGLGLAAMLSVPVPDPNLDPDPTARVIVVKTSAGGIGDDIELRISSGEKISVVVGGQKADSCCAHFSVPAAQWWTDVRFACGTILTFPSVEEVDDWTVQRGFRRGESLGVETLWELAKVWYHDKHLAAYDRKSKAEAEKVFKGLGLTSGFWAL